MIQKKITVIGGELTGSVINFLNSRGIIVSDLDEPQDHILIEDEAPFPPAEEPESLDVTKEFDKVKEKIREMCILCESIEERSEEEEDYDPSDDLDILEFQGDTLEDLMMELWVAKEGFKGNEAAEKQEEKEADKLAHEMLEMKTRRNVTDLQEIVACQGETLEIQEDEICRMNEKVRGFQDRLTDTRDEVRRHIDNHLTNETEQIIHQRVTDAILSFNKKYEELEEIVKKHGNALDKHHERFGNQVEAIRQARGIIQDNWLNLHNRVLKIESFLERKIPRTWDFIKEEENRNESDREIKGSV